MKFKLKNQGGKWNNEVKQGDFQKELGFVSRIL